MKVKTLEKLKGISRKAFTFKPCFDEDGKALLYRLATDYFNRLKKECTEIADGPSDKILCVLMKNMNTALDKKKQAAAEMHKLKTSLDRDHSVKAIRKEVEKRQSGNCSQELSGREEGEGIPDECDNRLFKVQIPMESTSFFNRFQTFKTIKSN